VLLGSEPEAQDAVQDAVVTAWGRFDQLRDHGRFDAWFGRILVNVCRQWLRNRARQRVRPLAEVGEPAMPDASGPASARDAISRAMTGLDPDHRIVIVLRYWADLSVDEIASRIGVPAGTVKSRLHYALRSMRCGLEQE
jgi:RNA polymerase sigma-70 factor (ECF subfamily)